MALGYGVDTWCGASRVTGRLSRRWQTLGLALFRRLITPRGTLRGGRTPEEAAVYGFDVAGFVGRVGYARALGALPSMIAAELRKDDRVADVLVEVSKVTEPNGDIALAIVCHVTPVNEGADFDLTMSATDAALTLVGSLARAA